MCTRNCNLKLTFPIVCCLQKRMQSQQMQTSDSDDQWEWQRVWKGAFEKIRSDLDDKNKQNRTLELEVKVTSKPATIS